MTYRTCSETCKDDTYEGIHNEEQNRILYSAPDGAFDDMR